MRSRRSAVNLRAVAECAHKQSKKLVSEDGYHAPVLFVHGQHENKAVLLKLGKSDQLRDRRLFRLGRHLAYLKPQYVVFISEALQSYQVIDDDEPADTPPGQQQARSETVLVTDGELSNPTVEEQEVLTVTVQTSRLRSWVMITPFVRVGSDIVFGETLSYSAAESNLLENFWRGVFGDS